MILNDNFQDTYKQIISESHTKGYEIVEAITNSKELVVALMKEFGDDPIYAAVIKATNAQAGKKAMKQLSDMRGPAALKRFNDFGQKLVGTK